MLENKSFNYGIIFWGVSLFLRKQKTDTEVIVYNKAA